MTFLGVYPILYRVEMLLKKNMPFEGQIVSVRFNILDRKNLEAKYYAIAGNQ